MFLLMLVLNVDHVENLSNIDAHGYFIQAKRFANRLKPFETVEYETHENYPLQSCVFNEQWDPAPTSCSLLAGNPYHSAAESWTESRVVSLVIKVGWQLSFPTSLTSQLAGRSHIGSRYPIHPRSGLSCAMTSPLIWSFGGTGWSDDACEESSRWSLPVLRLKGMARV